MTGLPGNGKTYYTVAKAPELLAHPGRTIYYDGIADLTLPWEPCDGETWYNLPDGSAVVIDEAQKVFRPMPAGAERPRKVRDLETHRHRGFDIWLITQDPGLLDSHVRRLVGKHIHVHRPFGMGRFNWWAWEKVEDPNDYHAKKRAVTGHLAIRPDVYRLYKSAEIHTVKRRLPWKLFLLPIGVAAAGMLAWLGFSTLKGSAEPKSSQPGAVSQAGPVKAANGPYQRVTARLEAIKPDLPNLPHTAPRYDGLTAPVAVPVVRGCFVNRAVIPSRCWCVSQRGTRVQTSREFCEQVVNEGLPFYDFEPEQGDQRQASPSPGSATPVPVKAPSQAIGEPKAAPVPFL